MENKIIVPFESRMPMHAVPPGHFVFTASSVWKVYIAKDLLPEINSDLAKENVLLHVSPSEVAPWTRGQITHPEQDRIVLYLGEPDDKQIAGFIDAVNARLRAKAEELKQINAGNPNTPLNELRLAGIAKGFGPRVEWYGRVIFLDEEYFVAFYDQPREMLPEERKLYDMISQIPIQQIQSRELAKLHPSQIPSYTPCTGRDLIDKKAGEHYFPIFDVAFEFSHRLSLIQHNAYTYFTNKSGMLNDVLKSKLRATELRTTHKIKSLNDD